MNKILVVAIVFMLIFQSSFTLHSINDDIWAEQVILKYINDKKLNITQGTIEYSNLMKGILLGEHPDLINPYINNSNYVDEKDMLINYAIAHCNSIHQSNNEIKEIFVNQVIIPIGIDFSLASESQTENRVLAIEYAYEWSIDGGIKRNPEYPDFGDEDCTNFISQALRAGHRPMFGNGDGCTSEDTNTEWYSSNNDSPPIWCINEYRDWEWSTSWSIPYTFRDYMAYQNYYAIEIGWTVDPSIAKYYLSPGDVIQIQAFIDENWVTYHTMFITSEDYNTVYVTYHSSGSGLDVVDKSLYDIPLGSSERLILI